MGQDTSARVGQKPSAKWVKSKSALTQPRRKQKSIVFTYRLPASFADGGVSERFTILSVTTDDQYVVIQASDTSEFRIARTLLGYGEHALLLEAPPPLIETLSLGQQREIDAR